MGDLISIKPMQLAHRIDREAYNEFERFCISLVRDADEIARAIAEAKSTIRIPEKALAIVSESLAAFQRRGISKASLQERRERFRELAKVEPEFAKDESGRLRREAVGAELMMLLGSFPTSNVPNSEVYSLNLLEDVLNADYDFLLSIYGGCREIRRTQKFMPSVSEVLEFIAENNAFWLSAFNASESIVEKFAELIELRDEMPEKIKEREAERIKERDAAIKCAAEREDALIKRFFNIPQDEPLSDELRQDFKNGHYGDWYKGIKFNTKEQS